jgi:LPS sulfotransferase NodH
MIVLVDPNNGPAGDFPAHNGPSFVYAIAAIPRSGSTLVSRALRTTRHAGTPSDYFKHEAHRDFEQRAGPLSQTAYRDLLLRHRTSPNGVFGFKIHWDQMVGYFRRGDEIAFRNLISPKRVIYTFRGDRLRQAVSWTIATQTKRFTSETPELLRPRYDHTAIKTALRLIREHEIAWQQLFRREGIEHLPVEYERLSSCYSEVMREIADFLGLSISDDFATPPISRLAGAETDEWVARYRSNTAV